jgi:4'-phosphopantetheinyl transferase EntD
VDDDQARSRDVTILFDLDLEHGRCVGLRIEEGAALALHDEERAHARTLTSTRAATWTAGRAALHAALERLGESPGALLATARGAPELPAHLVGSISHKETVAVGLAARARGDAVGVDVELDRAPRGDIGRMVLRDEERAEVEALPPDERALETLLRFSAKEALYKALDRYVGRYVGFKEARMTPLADGTARVELFLAKGEGPFDVEARWRRVDRLVLTTARVAPR